MYHSYKIVAISRSAEKDFSSTQKRFSKNVWNRMLDTLTTVPHEGKKVMQFHKYDLPEGYRIVYVIISNDTVAVVGAGNHRYYEKLLTKIGRKK